jgi:hypothetical protein
VSGQGILKGVNNRMEFLRRTVPSQQITMFFDIYRLPMTPGSCADLQEQTIGRGWSLTLEADFQRP